MTKHNKLLVCRSFLGRVSAAEPQRATTDVRRGVKTTNYYITALKLQVEKPSAERAVSSHTHVRTHFLS